MTAFHLLGFLDRPAFRAQRARRANAARIRAARRELRMLDDRLLRDIGLTRDEVGTMDL